MRIQRGWKPKLDDNGAPTAYHNALDVGATGLNSTGADIAEAVVKAAVRTGDMSASSGPGQKHSDEVQNLFRDRRNEQDPDVRKDLSKKLWKALRQQRRRRHQDRLDTLVQEGAGVRKLLNIRTKQSGTSRINKVRDKDGALQTDPESICEVFAKFYSDLYAGGDRRATNGNGNSRGRDGGTETS